MMSDICMIWAEPSDRILFDDRPYVNREEIVRTIGERSRGAQMVLNDVLLRKWQKGEQFDETEIAKLLSDCGFDVEKTYVSFDICSLKYQLPRCYWLRNV